MRDLNLGYRFWLEVEGVCVIDEWGAKLLEALSFDGDIARAADSCGLQTGDVAELLAHMESVSGFPINDENGLTEDGMGLLVAYRSRTSSVKDLIRKRHRNPVLTVDGIVSSNEGLLLIRRGKDPYDGMHALPGGFVEYGESAEDAVVREVREETGLETRILELLGAYSAPERDPRGHTVTLVYLLSPLRGEPRGGDDARDAGYFPIDSLPDLAFDHADIVADYLSSSNRRAREFMQ